MLEKQNKVSVLGSGTIAEGYNGADVAATDDSAGERRRTSTLVGCGTPSAHPDIDVIIVDTKTYKKLPEGHVGEIWITR